MAKIIITGSAGYIGSQLAKALDENELLLADRKNGIDILDNFYEKYKSFKPDLIYHLAAQIEVQSKDPLQMLKDNVLGTIEITKFDCPVIFTSTAGVYGDKNTPASEEDEPNPENIYTITKLASEKILKNAVILRFANAWGGQGGKGVFQKLRDGAKIFGDGKNTRDFIHIDDIVSALIQAKNWKSGVYNIGTGKEISVNKLADILGVKKVYAPPVKEQKRSCLNIKKTLKTGWKPLIHLL